MKKRILTIFAVFCFVLNLNIAMAANVSTKDDSDIELMYEQVMNMSAKLNISSFLNNGVFSIFILPTCY